MQQDAQGNALSTAGADSARAFDHTIAGYLGYRFDTAQRMQALLAADPDCGMAHALKAAFAAARLQAGLRADGEGGDRRGRHG